MSSSLTCLCLLIKLHFHFTFIWGGCGCLVMSLFEVCGKNSRKRKGGFGWKARAYFVYGGFAKFVF